MLQHTVNTPYAILKIANECHADVALFHFNMLSSYFSVASYHDMMCAAPHVKPLWAACSTTWRTLDRSGR